MLWIYTSICAKLVGLIIGLELALFLCFHKIILKFKFLVVAGLIWK